MVLLLVSFIVSALFCLAWPLTLHHQRRLPTNMRFKTRLHAYGDPDTQLESTVSRAWQGWLRAWDAFVFPNDPDVPGLTFPTPIEVRFYAARCMRPPYPSLTQHHQWAPWMETVWMGNYYDYRSAFFSDVMYTNNVPGKEGALLYRDSARAMQMALLYQVRRLWRHTKHNAARADS